MKKTFIFVLALVIALGISLVAAMPVAADPGTTYYVSTTGSDVTGDGSYSDPWGTIQHAVDQVSSGDTIMVAPGTYTGATVGKNVTISGLGPGDTVIDTGVPYKAGSGLTTAFRLDAGADGAQITDFVVNNNAGTSFYFAIFARAVDDVTIDNLEINDTVQGITNWGGSGWTITNNTITDTVAAGGGGIGIFLGALEATSGYGTCSENLVQYNVIHGTATAPDYSCPAICLSLDLRWGGYLAVNGSEDISGNQILDNTITASGVENVVGIEVGVIGLDGDPDKIDAIMTAAPVHDNTVQENDVDGADIGIYFYNATNLTITQNTVQNNVGYGMYGEHGQNGTVITDNTFTNNEIQLADETDDTETLDSLDIASILTNNTFDRAVTVDHPGASLLHTIWSHIQDAIDAASTGDTINVAAGTYTEYLHITTDGLTIQGAGIDQSIIDLDGLTPYWHYSGSGSFASRAGVLISGYGSSGEVIEDVAFKGFTVKNAGLNPPITATGTHTGADNAAVVLTDSTKSWTIDALVGQWIHNYGDRDTDYNPARSYGQITANTATTVTVASLSGGKENDWDTGDPYLITPYEEFHNKIWVHYPNYDGLRGIGIGNGKNVTIQNCKVTNCGYGGIGSGYARLVSTHKYSEGITVDNCIVTDHLTSGISIGQNVGALTITNNLVERNKRPNYEDASRENAGRGIEVSGSKYGYGPASGLIADNIVNDNGFEGIILASYTDGVTVEDNTVTGHNLDQDGAGIFFYGASSNPANCKNNIIRNNTVTGNIRGIVAYYAQACTIEGNNITTDSGAFALGQAAIKIDGGNNIAVNNNAISCDGVGIKIQKTWNGVDCYDNTFTGNTIDGAMFAGVYITSGAHDNTFTCNTIRNTVSHTFTQWADWGVHDGGDDQATLADSGKSWTTDALVGMTVMNLDDGSEGVITANTATTVTATLSGGTEDDWDNGDDYDIVFDDTHADGVYLRGGMVYAGGHAGTGNVFNHNNIYDNPGHGLSGQLATTVDARYNWWGDASGPYHNTTNPLATGDSVSDNVDYSPWWGANYIGVGHPWDWYTNDSVQDAIDTASAGDTVNVMAGTYVEDLVIPAGKDGLELKGAGCNLTIIKGVATSAGTPVYNIRFDEFDGVSGVKIHGFTIESPDVPTNHFASGMVLNGQDIEIYDNCFVSKGAESAVDNYCVAIQTWRWSAAPDSDLTGLKIYNNTFSSEGDLWVYQGVFVNRDGEDFGDVTVSGNNFTGNIHMGIAYEGNNAVISDNAMTSTYEGVGIAIMDWAELEQDDVDVDGNELQGFDYGVLVGRGAQVMANITVANNVFSNNNYQVRDRADTLNMEDVLAQNDFDRAVVVRGSGIKVPTIFSSIQDAIDAAVAGDTVDVGVGTYTGFEVTEDNLTIQGPTNAVVSGAAPGRDAVVYIGSDVDSMTIQGLTIDAAGVKCGIRATESGTYSDIAVLDSIIKDFKKSGVVVRYASEIQLEGNHISTTDHSEAPNGIQVGNVGDTTGTTGTIKDNQISGCYWDGYDPETETYEDDWTGSGILVIDTSSALDISDNEVHSCDVGMDIESGTPTTITSNDVHDNSYGFVLWNAAATINYNTVHENALYGVYCALGGSFSDVDATANWWGALTGPYHEELNPDGEGDNVSDHVLFEPWYGDEGMTTLVGHSTYEFVYDVPDVIVALEETLVPVTFETDALGVVGYYGVRFKFNATGPGEVIFKATDSEDMEHTFVDLGFWGPSAGFNLTADYSATTDWSLNFSEPGEYTITFSLIEAPDGDVVAGIEDSEEITVRAVDILDHYRHLNVPYDEVTMWDLLAAADDWIANEVPPGFDKAITLMQLLSLADEWIAGG